MNILIPMAGSGSRFKTEGYSLPKPLILVDNEPMIVRATKSLPLGSSHYFVCQKEHLNSWPIESILKSTFINTTVIPINNLTKGQAVTCLIAKKFINNTEELFIGACDNGIIWDKNKFELEKQNPNIDAIIWSFRNNPTVLNNPNAYGWAKTDNDNNLIYISCKTQISTKPLNDHAIIGAFWFRQGKNFVAASEQMIKKNITINNEFYVDTIFNEFESLGLKAKIFEAEQYICWGTPTDLKTYEYWKSFFQLTAKI